MLRMERSVEGNRLVLLYEKYSPSDIEMRGISGLDSLQYSIGDFSCQLLMSPVSEIVFAYGGRTQRL